jgi:hypothetical protein
MQSGLEHTLESLYQAYKAEEDAKVRERILMNVRLLEGKSTYEVGFRIPLRSLQGPLLEETFQEDGC